MTYDLIIIGTGPAGYSAAIYATRYKLNTLLIGKDLGGMAAIAHKVENWPGDSSIVGYDLMKKFYNHVDKLKVPIKNEFAKRLIKSKNIFEVFTDKNKYQAKTLILAMGTERLKLNVPGEKKFIGKGVNYCATCDAFFYPKKTVAVIGGGNAATMAALQLADIAKKVYLIIRRDEFTAEPFQVELIKKNPTIQIITNNNVIKIAGDSVVKAIELKNPYNNKKLLDLDGIFIEIGSVPTNSALIRNLGVKVDDKNFILVNHQQATNVSGVFAAGDITNASAGLRQIITSAAEGAIASFAAYKYIKKIN